MVEIKARYPDFAERLNAAMHEAGVSVTDLKNRLNITYEMARRYTLGIAMPRDDKLVAISDYLGVDAAGLKFGNDSDRKLTKQPARGLVAATKRGDFSSQQKWPLKKATLERILSLSPQQLSKLDDAMDLILIGMESHQQNS